MKRTFIGLLLVLGLAWTPSAPGQSIFSKKPKVNPSQRVPELIVTLKTEKDERKRTAAAEELRDYDSVTFTEIVPVLADVLKNDKKVGVRLEALNSLAKIRPVTTLAGQAIEKAASEDDTLRLRWQAKAALAKYQLAGYSAKKSEPAKGKTTEEPPLATVPEAKTPPAKTVPEKTPEVELPLPMPRYESPPRVPDAENPAPPKPLPKDVAPMKGPSLFP
jgi:hypothetical protein